MKLLDSILRTMGFEAGEPEQNQTAKEPKPKKEKRERVHHMEEKPRASFFAKKEKPEPAPKKVSKFDLINDILPQYEGGGESAGGAAGSVSLQANENGVSVSKNVIVYSPKNHSDMKNLVDFLRRKEPIIVNFEKLDDDIAPAMVSFISGALYALKGSIHPISEGLYLLTPEGVNILIPKERKKV
ncbi:MAG: cell division protein SepF [Firmicutes bacterium]|nr:cell division protein SepF [Bacillota bacterium]MCL2770974.1 cell division protein SepF [Bacillota bacterium]